MQPALGATTSRTTTTGTKARATGAAADNNKNEKCDMNKNYGQSRIDQGTSSPTNNILPTLASVFSRTAWSDVVTLVISI
jgi:hypothetical protein